jgi:enoyl-CoA hydratase
VNGISARTDGPVLRIVLDRPEKRNAVNTPMLVELRSMIENANDDAVRVVSLTGAGPAFCAGGDLTGKDTDGAAVAANDVVRAIMTLPKPVVAGVRGAAAGFGAPLALACDLVVAGRSASFQLAFARVGLMPDGGATALLPAAIGRARAARMALLAEKVTADTAFSWGMISHVVDDDALDDEFESVLQHLATGPTLSYGWTKRALAVSTMPTLCDAQAIEAEGQGALVNSTYFRRAVGAFRNRDHATQRTDKEQQ